MSLRLRCDALTTCVLLAALLSAGPAQASRHNPTVFHGTRAQVDRWRAAHPLPATCPVGRHPESGSRYHGDAATAWSGCIVDGTYRDADGHLRPLPAATATPPPAT